MGYIDEDKIQLDISDHCVVRAWFKINHSMEHTMRRKKRIKQGRKGKDTILAAKWADQELIDGIKLRVKYNRQWRYARKKGAPEEEIKICETRYKEQKKKTLIMTELKKSTWEKKEDRRNMERWEKVLGNEKRRHTCTQKKEGRRR